MGPRKETSEAHVSLQTWSFTSYYEWVRHEAETDRYILAKAHWHLASVIFAHHKEKQAKSPSAVMSLIASPPPPFFVTAPRFYIKYLVVE